MSKKFVKLEKDLCYPKYIFCNDEAKKVWEGLDPKIKKTVQQNIKEYVNTMITKDSIDFLAILYLEIIERLEKLEDIGHKDCNGQRK